jgi:hypothetical protein
MEAIEERRRTRRRKDRIKIGNSVHGTMPLDYAILEPTTPNSPQRNANMETRAIAAMISGNISKKEEERI